MGVLAAHCIQILPQDSFAAHCVYERNFHARQLYIGGHEVYTLWVVQNALAGGDGLVGQDLAHYVRESDGQIVRMGIAQTDCKAGLWITIDQENFFPSLSQSCAEIYTACRFCDTALLIDQGNDLGVHGFSTPFYIEQFGGWKEGGTSYGLTTLFA